MTITPDIITIAGWVLGGLGIVLLVFELKGDRARGRLRCKRCWYDLRDTPRVDGGWTCPECGKRLVREHQMRRTRRRWKLVAIALVLLTTPGGLYAGRVAQDHGWPSLLPDWVLARMPIDVDWVIKNPDSGKIDLLWRQSPWHSLQRIVSGRFEEFSPQDKRTYRQRLQRTLNEERRDSPDGLLLYAYDIADLADPPRTLVERYPTAYAAGCVNVATRVSPFAREFAASDDLAESITDLVDLITNFESRDTRVYCKQLTGLLLVRSDAAGHRRAEQALDAVRARPGSHELAEDRWLRWYDLSDLLPPSDTWNESGPFFNIDDIHYMLNDLVAPDDWTSNGGNLIGGVSIGDELAIVAPSAVHARLAEVLTIMRDRDGAPVTSIESGQRITIRAYDIADSVDDLMSRINRKQRPATDTNCGAVAIEEEVADTIRTHLTETVEPDAWIDNGGDDASLRYWNGIFLVRTTLDLDERIRTELARIERGEVELDF